jgi:DNA-binding XRE family transcriptional regulator
MSKTRRPYTSLQDYLERTGTTQQDLAKMVGISGAHLSNILKGSRRCSLKLGVALAAVTGVPVEKIVQWPKVRVVRSYLSVA